MKFINYLESIAGVGIYPLVSLIIFFSFFLVLGTWALRADKNYLRRMEHLPLDDTKL